MSFNDLTTELQNVLLVNHSYMTKWFIFLFIIFISAFYVWGIWPNHKKTIYITQAIMRVFFFGLSVVYLVTAPLLILLMNYDYSFGDFYNLPLIFYGIFTSVLFIVLFADFVRLGIFYVLGVAGLDLGSDTIRELRSKIEDNKHFLKMGKWKKYVK